MLKLQLRQNLKGVSLFQIQLKIRFFSTMKMMILATEFVLSFSPEGIVINDNEFYIVDASGTRIRTFQFKLVFSTNDDFNLHSTNLNPLGTTIYDNKIWVVDVTTSDVEVTEDIDIFWIADSTDNHLYAYDENGNRHSDLEASLSFSPEGVTVYDSKLWILDSDGNRIVPYDTSGSLLPDDFNLHEDNDNAVGVTFYNNHFYVANIEITTTTTTDTIYWIFDVFDRKDLRIHFRGGVKYQAVILHFQLQMQIQ